MKIFYCYGRLAPILLLAACTVTGPADDGFENSQEYIDIGRLGREDGEAYTIFSTEHITSRKDADKQITDGLDYSDYQLWQEARQNNSAEYRRYLKWKEFEAFDAWKQQQNSQ